MRGGILDEKEYWLCQSGFLPYRVAFGEAAPFGSGYTGSKGITGRTFGADEWNGKFPDGRDGGISPKTFLGDVIHCGALSIDLRLRRVIRDGKEIALTPKEFDILYFLARNRGEVFTKEQIYQAVWESDYLLDDSNIMAFIRKLRKKIEPNPDAPEYILTIWGIGYKFNDKTE